MTEQNQKTMSFLNSEVVLSIIQGAEIQYQAYQKFLDLTGNEKEAMRQTMIYMWASIHNPLPPDKKGV